MRISNNDQFPLDPILGAGPQLQWGNDTPIGAEALAPFKDWTIGTLYVRQHATSSNVKVFIKIDAADTTGTWLTITAS